MRVANVACVVMASSLAAACAVRLGAKPETAQGSSFFAVPAKPVCTSGYRNIDDVDDVALPSALISSAGLVASVRQADVWYAIANDPNGASVVVFANDGASLGGLRLPGVTTTDVQDIAIGPCPDLQGPCIYLADTGNSALDRERLAVLAFAEPVIDAGAAIGAVDVKTQIWRFFVVAPEPPVSSAALVVMPNGNAMVLLEAVANDASERDARILTLRAPWLPEADNVAEATGTVRLPGVITGADLHPTATRMLLRTTRGVWEAAFDLDRFESPLQIDSSRLVELMTEPTWQQPGGGAVAYDGTGLDVVTLSDSNAGAGLRLGRAACEAAKSAVQ